MCDIHLSNEFVLTEEQEARILEIAMAVNNEIEKGIFYRYDGPSAQRQFCRILTGLNKLYTKDDINRMSFQGLNSQFAKRGTNRYSIFKYRGGANCKHYWREVEIIIDEDGLPREYDRGIVDDSRVERLNFEEQINKIKNNKMNYYELVFDGTEEDGVYGVSLVSDPAIEMEAIKFSDDKKLEIKMADEDKRILISPVLIPNQKVYRNFNGEEAYVYFSAETIERLQQNFFKNNYNHNSKLEHKDKIEGVYFFESWIIEDPELDKAKALGYNLPKGTWMMAMKVENDVIWKNYVKTGLVTGFSIDAFMKLKQINQNKKMNKIETLFKNALKQAILEMEAEKQLIIKISDELSYYTNEPLAMDVIVYDNVTGELISNTDFIFEGKEYKTGQEGQIISIEDIVEEEKREELEFGSIKSKDESVTIYFEGSMMVKGGMVYSDEALTQPLSAGEYQLESDMTIVVDEAGMIIEIKEPIEMSIEEDLAAKEALVLELEAKLAEKEALVLELEVKLAEAESKITKLEADFVLKENEVITMSKQTPASLGIIDRPTESPVKATSALGAIRNVLKSNK